MVRDDGVADRGVPDIAAVGAAAGDRRMPIRRPTVAVAIGEVASSAARTPSPSERKAP